MVNRGVQVQAEYPRHIPVLLNEFLDQLTPFQGVWIDGTFGDGGYSKALLESGARSVIAIDRDPEVVSTAALLSRKYSTKFYFTTDHFSKLDDVANLYGFSSVDGIILDLGVSSMQIDEAKRGFSFQKNGPLDMRMSCSGLSAFEIVNFYSEKDLANIIYTFGEERLSRRIASKIVEERKKQPIDSTEMLTSVISKSVSQTKYTKTHPATRTFQALRIFINNELEELVRALEAAERILSPDGILAVITFHSIEDRIVKRFIQLRSELYPKANRHQPLQLKQQPSFKKVTKKGIVASDKELEVNSRSRSAKLRIARKLECNAVPIRRDLLGLPFVNLETQKK